MKKRNKRKKKSIFLKIFNRKAFTHSQGTLIKSKTTFYQTSEEIIALTQQSIFDWIAVFSILSITFVIEEQLSTM